MSSNNSFIPHSPIKQSSLIPFITLQPHGGTMHGNHRYRNQERKSFHPEGDDEKRYHPAVILIKKEMIQ